MKIVIHPEIREAQFYRCLNCGRGCRSFLVPVKQKEKESILKQRDWPAELGTDNLFVKSKLAGPSQLGLQKRANGDCVFLDENNLCLIHKHHGLAAKPIACQLFPFVLTPFAGELRVGLRFDCPGVCQSDGPALSSNMKDLHRLAQAIVPEGGANVDPPELKPKVKISADYFNAVNETLIQIAASNTVDLRDRLIWLYRFGLHISRIKWHNVQPNELDDLIGMFKNAIFAEMQQMDDQPQPPERKARQTLGQIFFLLCHPVELITCVKRSPIDKMKSRLSDTAIMSKLSATSGPLPPLCADWPACDMADLENSLDGWPDDVQDFLERYLVCRLAGLNYCGPNFYGYSLVEGLNTLLLAMVTVGWLLRIYTSGAGRDAIDLADAHRAIITIDGNLGYGKALNAGPARMRLDYLSGQLETLIDWYCH